MHMSMEDAYDDYSNLLHRTRGNNDVLENCFSQKYKQSRLCEIG